MRSFKCVSCGGALFFENDACLACGQKVGFRADELAMTTIAAAASANLAPCRNWTELDACNWFTAAGDSGYCISCSLNEVVPDLQDPQRVALWVETERAKRRLLFTLLELGLPLSVQGKEPLRFRLLADRRVDTGEVEPPKEEPIYIGHDSGRLTLNIVEADDAVREAMRKRMNERYRTMLGHLRHEIGHYYWYLLVDGTRLLGQFRELFGDERTDYNAALAKHYESGPPQGWQESFVSAYATVHPWEDFAETWAHYIHIVDTLETASGCGVAIGGAAVVSPLPIAVERPFAATLSEWLTLAVCLNQLTRSMGMRDAYPFSLTDRVIEKLEFVHAICLEAPREGAPRLGQRGATDVRVLPPH
jgi:hypothetical protein